MVAFYSLLGSRERVARVITRVVGGSLDQVSSLNKIMSLVWNSNGRFVPLACQKPKQSLLIQLAPVRLDCSQSS